MGSYAYSYCMCFTRKFRSPETQPPLDVCAAFAAAAGGAAAVNGDGIRRFLAGEQGEDTAYAERVVAQIAAAAAGGGGAFARFVRAASPAATVSLSRDEFFNFLFSDELNPPIRSEVHHDMLAPLSHYYIFTGHNSYLTGNQLNSDSSDVPIIKALQRGVRVIELDMWPNSAKDNIDILHGRTLTAPVDLIKCLKSIKDYAFCASVYPLVITLEDHLTPDLQAKVAEMLIETFGDLLYVPGMDPPKEFPSPEALKKRIIISTKPPKEYLETTDNKNGSQKRINLAEEVSLRKEATDSYAEESDEKDEQDQYDEQDEEESDDDDPKFQQHTADQYRRLIAIQAGKKKGHMRDSLKVDPDKVRRLSLSETQLAKATSSHGADVIRFTQMNLLRVYPKGTRINSSNYDPFDAWIHGAQMVAFNMQGHDKALRLMQGFFRANGGCGYVKKPDFLLKTGPHGEVFDPTSSLVKKTLKVKVYMGDGWRLDFSKTHFDTFSPPDFYTRVGIAGVPADSIMKRTRTIEDQWVPVWDEEFTFPLTVPELALLRMEVQEYDMSERPDFGGQTCLPVSDLRQGIRAVPLYDRKGVKYKSVRLLMRFDFI